MRWVRSLCEFDRLGWVGRFGKVLLGSQEAGALFLCIYDRDTTGRCGIARFTYFVD